MTLSLDGRKCHGSSEVFEVGNERSRLVDLDAVKLVSSCVGDILSRLEYESEP